MAAKIDLTGGRYIFILHDGEALPTVSPETAVRPGTLAVRYPSRDTWVYTGREWSREPVLGAITLVQMLSILQKVLAQQEELLTLWKQQVE